MGGSNLYGHAKKVLEYSILDIISKALERKHESLSNYQDALKRLVKLRKVIARAPGVSFMRVQPTSDKAWIGEYGKTSRIIFC